MTAGPVPSALGGRGACAAAAIGALLLAIAVSFALNFPALTGRIVDQANIIQPATRAAMEGKLAELESQSGIQLVLARVNSMEGRDIEPYATVLFLRWKLGERKNNGVLLLVAPNERRVRSRWVTDLRKLLPTLFRRSSLSMRSPRFKAGDFSGGISRGAGDIITVLTTDASEWEQPVAAARQRPAERSGELDTVLCISRFHYIDCRIADLPQVVHIRADQCFGQFRPIRRWRVFRRWLFGRRGILGRRRVFRWRWVFGRWWRFGKLVMNISKEDQDRTRASARRKPNVGRVVACWQPQRRRRHCRSLSPRWSRLRCPGFTAFTAMTVFRILSLQIVVFWHF